MKEKENKKNYFKTGGVFALRLSGTFIVVFFVGYIGIRHYSSAHTIKRDKNRLNWSGNLIERTDSSPYMSKEILSANGIDFEIIRSATNTSVEEAKKRITVQKLGLGWEKMKIPAKSIPFQSLNLTGKQDAFEFFITQKNRIEGYRFTKDKNCTKITSVSFDLKKLTDKVKKNGGDLSHSPVSSPLPSEYLALMPAVPIMSMTRPDNTERSEMYVCSIAEGQYSAITSQIKTKLDSNGWKRELWEEVAEHSNLLQDHKMITARKNSTLCNIIVSKEKNDVIISYRFSKLNQAKLRR